MTDCYVKADDISTEVNDRWTTFLEICVQKDVPAHLGFISSRCEAMEIPEAQKTLLAAGNFPIFNHGHFHTLDIDWAWEFQNSSYASQIRSIEQCQQVAEIVFGSRSRMFGPPFNKYDASTISALMKFPEISHVFDVPFVPGKERCISKSHYVECEGPANGRRFGHEAAREKSQKILKADVPFVLQIHPGNQWEPDCFARFADYIDEMRGFGVNFKALV